MSVTPTAVDCSEVSTLADMIEDRVCFVPSHPARDLDLDLKRAGIPKLSVGGKLDFHACRVAFINLAIETGVNVTVYDVLAAQAEQADIERPSPHDLRRSCIWDLLDRGNDLAVVQRLAGHASPVTTARYDRRPDNAARRAAETLTVPFVPAG